jgi:hypothetical protein
VIPNETRKGNKRHTDWERIQMHRTINTEKDLLIYFNKHLARMRR